MGDGRGGTGGGGGGGAAPPYIYHVRAREKIETRSGLPREWRPGRGDR